MHRTTSIRRPAAAALIAAALLVAGCSSSGSDDADKADKTTTTEAAAKTTTTTTAEEETTTTEATDPAGDGPTTDDLAALLPAADELGDGWAEDTTEQDEEAAIETATKEACPDAAALLAPAEDDEATRAYENDPAGTTVRISLSPSATEVDPADLQGVVDSINACAPVTASEGGFDMTASFTAAANDTYGDQGIQIDAAVTLTDGTASYDLHKYRLLFRDGTVGVTISGGDGLLDDGTVNPIDGADLEAIAAEMASRVGSL